jgi:transcription termination factor NusB
MSAKKIVYISNCQSLGILYYLNKSAEFTRQYDDIHGLYNYDHALDDNDIRKIQEADLIIHQKVMKLDNPVHLDNISHLFKQGSRLVTLPVIYNDGYFPLTETREYVVKNGKCIEKYINAGLSLDEVLDLYDKNELDFEIKSRFEACINTMKEREKDLDLKISDYIENTKHVRLFLITNHPTSYVFLEAANRLLKLLDIEPIHVKIEHNNEPNLPGFYPLAQQVIDALGLTAIIDIT